MQTFENLENLTTTCRPVSNIFRFHVSFRNIDYKNNIIQKIKFYILAYVTIHNNLKFLLQ